ncbi:MAG: hypothetical protein AAF640_12120 [Pseudomonadota bacterium]
MATEIFATPGAPHRVINPQRAWLLALLLPLAGCDLAVKPDLKLHAPPNERVNFEGLSGVLQDEVGIRLSRDPTVEVGDDPVASLLDGSADLAIVDNTRPFVSGLRVVLNLYTAVVHLSVRDDLDVNTGIDKSTLRIEVLHNAHAGGQIVELLNERSAQQEQRPLVQRWRPEDGGEPDMQLYVGPINPKSTAWFREGFRLAPISDLDEPGAEFYLEGIRYLVPQFRRTRIPALTYTLPGNERGIEALAVDMLLISHRRVRPLLIFGLARTLIEQKARFAAVEPQLFRWLNTSFEAESLAFPLHTGARMYLERDEPGFLERYAETLNFLVYLLVLIITGLLAFGRWRARRRKDRIDEFYKGVFDLRRGTALRGTRETLEALDQLEAEAFEALIGERLGADDSFRIFTELVDGLRNDLRLMENTASPVSAGDP